MYLSWQIYSKSYLNKCNSVLDISESPKNQHLQSIINVNPKSVADKYELIKVARNLILCENN